MIELELTCGTRLFGEPLLDPSRRGWFQLRLPSGEVEVISIETVRRASFRI